MQWGTLLLGIAGLIFAAGGRISSSDAAGAQLQVLGAKIASIEARLREIEISGTSQSKATEISVAQLRGDVARLAGDMARITAGQDDSRVQVARLAALIERRAP